MWQGLATVSLLKLTELTVKAVDSKGKQFVEVSEEIIIPVYVQGALKQDSRTIQGIKHKAVLLVTQLTLLNK